MQLSLSFLLAHLHELGNRQDSAPNSAETLQSLAPLFVEEQHGYYVRHLESALENDMLHNIALTGNYGIGKSSILRKVHDNNPAKVLNLSISTLGDPPPGGSADDNQPENASITNRIQKEIVKQLLYQARPSQLPHSSFRRLGKFHIVQKFLATSVLVLVVGVILALTGLLPVIWPDSPDRVPRWVPYAGLFFLTTGLLTYVQKVLNPRWSLSEVSAGGASISLSSAEPCFDEHLDEIVYFFEVMPFEIVVFEDIDRFGDPHIFEALRELNTLLNASAQLKNRSIRFVYAIKDSIFEQIGNDLAAEDTGIQETGDAAKLESARANRTKFFNLVIPVVPFITHRSSRDLMTDTFTTTATDRRISSALIDLTSKHITDMRLIKNIRNEFVVFADRLLSPDSGVPGLKADQLLAMIVYKNIHLSDFERISRGDSDLDTVYKLSRQTVHETVERLTQRDREIGDSIASAEFAPDRSIRLGAKLDEYLRRVARHTSPIHEPQTCSVNGQTFTIDQVSTPGFWALLAASNSELSVSIVQHGYNQQHLTIALADLRTALGDNLDSPEWIDEHCQELTDERAEIQRKLPLVRHGDIEKLMTDDDFTVSIGEQTYPFSTLVEEKVGSKLAVELIRSGYIDRNFTLYVSQYYGVRVSADVMTFIVRSVQTGTDDMHFSFSNPADIDALLAETDDTFLTDLSAYNISLVDHLTERGDSRLDSILGNIVRLGDKDREFLNAYLNNGIQKESFVSLITRTWSGIFEFLIGQAQIPGDDRGLLVSAALTGGTNDVVYDLGADNSVRRYIEDNATDLPCLTDPELSAHTAQVMSVLRHMSVRLPDITILSPEVRNRVVDKDLYDLTSTNLHVAICQESGSLALDTIRAQHPNVYRYCLANLDQYFSAVDADTTYLIDSPHTFSSVLAEIDDPENTDLIEKIINRSAPECLVATLPDVPHMMWSILARHNRFTPTLSNTEKYIEHFGEIDAALAGLLTHASTITDAEDQPQEKRKALAVTVLSSHETIPEPHVRIALAKGLELDYYINPSLITPEAGPLLAGLLEHEIVEDKIEIFTHFHGLGWDTLEAAIAQSANFASFISPELINEDALLPLFRSSLVPEPIKGHIVSAIIDFTPNQGKIALTAAIEYAQGASIRLGATQLLHVASAGVTPRTLIAVLATAGSTIPDETVLAILAAMPNPYPDLTGTGSKKFDLPNDEPHRTVIDRLRRQGIVRSSQQKRLNIASRTVFMH